MGSTEELCASSGVAFADRAGLRDRFDEQGSRCATGGFEANAVAAALDAVTARMPVVAGVAQRLSAEIRTPDLIEMAPGSTFLTQLAADESARGVPDAVSVFTWGGTSPRLVRARNWAFTADSAVPHVISVFPPKVN